MRSARAAAGVIARVGFGAEFLGVDVHTAEEDRPAVQKNVLPTDLDCAEADPILENVLSGFDAHVI